MTLHILQGHTQILEHIPTTLEWVAIGENEREDGRRKYTKHDTWKYMKHDDDNELLY